MTASRDITYRSAPVKVSMADRWFEIASIDHFWVQRRFDVLRQLAGNLVSGAVRIAEIGCGHGLLQRQIEDQYGREVTGFDLNEFALKQNVSRQSEVVCYDIYQRDSALRSRFDLIFLFDVLEHIEAEDDFLAALLFHLTPNGKLVLNVPAGQWAYSPYDTAAGHVRRYSARSLRVTATRNELEVKQWSYWGLPLLPALALRKLWLLGQHDQGRIISMGFDSRTNSLNGLLRLFSKCEPIPQELVGSSLMAVLGNTIPHAPE
jgi:SAM-dependent methyltransferase